MATINVYEQYFAADLTASGVPRKGALVMLISDSGGGMIKYEAAVTFFPHRDEEDFAVSYDAYYSKVLYEAAGRRSKQKEAGFLKEFQKTIDGLTKEAGGKVFWDKPLREARTDGGQLPEIKLNEAPAAEAGGSKKKESPEGKAERKLIAAVHELNEEQRDRIRKAAQAAGLSCRFFESPEEALPEVRDAEVIFANGISLIGSAPQLKWLATPFAGVDPYTKPGVFASPDAVLTNSSGAYGTTIAEHVVQVSLSMLRQDPVYRESVREKKWTRAVPIRSLRDSRIVLLGTGDIGREAAHRMKAFYPASLTGVNRSGKHPGGDFDRVVPLSGLDALLPLAAEHAGDLPAAGHAAPETASGRGPHRQRRPRHRDRSGRPGKRAPRRPAVRRAGRVRGRAHPRGRHAVGLPAPLHHAAHGRQPVAAVHGGKGHAAVPGKPGAVRKGRAAAAADRPEQGLLITERTDPWKPQNYSNSCIWRKN